MRNPLHSICPYFAMFPESFVQKQLLAYSRPGDKVFDPFCGRGTTILEGLLNDRNAIGSDINPVGACISGAKADIPARDEVLQRITALKEGFASCTSLQHPQDEFFSLCFEKNTLRQILFLQKELSWKDDPVDRFVAALMLGILHGESHKSELCLSNRMPRTISTKPAYSVRWWKEHQLTPPSRDAFEVLTKTALYRYAGEIPTRKGQVVLGDARLAGELLEEHKGSVNLIVTSPPYLDTTDYAEDQWLRLWFLGGPSRPTARLHKDDRHTRTSTYWLFLEEVWRGCQVLLKEDANLVVRIGGTMLGKDELFAGLLTSLRSGFGTRAIRPLHGGETSTIRRRQTNSFRPGTSPEKMEHDFAFAVIG
ncbi:DNA methyltransferase [Allomesorhizobium alhagi]|jgi:hypothetical protein|uniref:Methyltransferase n=1 Tax=Mesorhizobium alhagi CCNWXJ12-2 TaxID=1107882 RepID=H0HKN3_9HYPH|nr:DNA methyltransferase [Mesorhizobium alhagi]EHK58731.1 DNA methylase N-4/N-6 domain protein [Mesorhizobium alhagi CCNWXJ12-2]